MENPRRKISEDDRRGLLLLAIVLSPILLSLFFALTADEPKDDFTDGREDKVQSYTRSSSDSGMSIHSSAVYSSGTKDSENSLIKTLDEGDYYEYSDYHDGLDSEHSDLDYNEVRDYFED